MRKIVERLKERPEHHRRRVTFAASAGLTVLIFLVWVSVILPTGIKSTVAKSQPRQEADSPLGTLKNSVASVYEATKSLFNDASEQAQPKNLEEKYEEIKKQVESGELRIVPENSSNQ